VATLQSNATCKTKFTWVGSTMTTLANLQNAINWNYNVGPLMWRLKGRWQKKVGMFMHNIKTCILHDIVGCCPFPTWTQQNRWIFMGFKGWPKMQCDKLRVNAWGRPKLMHIQWKKHLKLNQKKGWMGEHTTKRLLLAMCKTSNMCDGIQRQVRKDARKRWSCNISKMLSWSRFAPLSTSCSKGGMHNVDIVGRSSHANLKWA
jgi:hypothetical protein